MSSIGLKIRNIRKQLGMNQVDFSKSIGISQGNLSEIELGNCKPSSDTLLAIREHFGTDLNWLLSNDNLIDIQDEHRFSSMEEQLLSFFRKIGSDGIEAQQDVIDYISFKLRKK
jgi:transcriptional regulator with XRE-family HTH domain